MAAFLHLILQVSICETNILRFVVFLTWRPFVCLRICAKIGINLEDLSLLNSVNLLYKWLTKVRSQAWGNRKLKNAVRVVLAIIKNNLKIEQAISTLSDILGLHSDMVSTLADLLAIIDVETQCIEEKHLRDSFLSFVNACLSIISEKVIKERLDVGTLADVGIIKNKTVFHTKFIRIKTKLFYKQQKFNLLREESEGYAKLITELNQEFTCSVTPDYILEVIKKLIGCFNLDPNRVLDIILESFENRPEHHEFFIPLMRSYMCDQNTLSEVLGFKFSKTLADKETPKSLYTVTALMLQYNLILMETIYPHLRPKDSDMVEQHKKNLADAHSASKKMATVSLSGEKTVEKVDHSEEKYKFNQKIGLCLALLEIGDWKHSQLIISRLPPYFAVSYKPIHRAMCNLLHYVITPVYRNNCQVFKTQVKRKTIPEFENSLSAKQATNFSDLEISAFPILNSLGLFLYTNPLLLVKVIRLARVYFTKKSKRLGNCGEDPLLVHFLNVIDGVLLPSLSILDCNCCIAEELWNLLRLLPYQQRYHLYARWKNDSYQIHPMLIKIRANTMKRISYIMKRLSKENVKPSGRHIGKLSHSNPGLLFDYILSQIQVWNNLIGPVVDSLKYLTNLSYDVLAYCIIEALANPEKQRMKTDGTSISLWLQNLDLLILKEIVQKMAGIEALEEMTADQLEAMSGGELLRAEGGYFSLIRNTKKSSQRLKDALLEQDLAIPLCILMAQQRNCVIYKEQESCHVKLVGKLYDQCQDTLVQFGSFLSTNLTMEDYTNRLPSVNELMANDHVMSDVAFFLARPLFTHAITSKCDELRKQDKGNKTNPQSRAQKYLEVVTTVMSPVVDSIKPLHPTKVWEDISPQFYMTFWSLTMYDLHVPAASYEREINKLKTQIAYIDDNKDMVQNKKKKEIERCKALMEKIQDEQKKQRDHCDRECANYPGFVTKFRVANQATESASDHVDYENYRHVCHKWHFKITKAMVTCLTSGDYVQIRNSLIILTKILPHYPVVSNLGNVIEVRIKNVQETEKQKRPDLCTLALAYLGQLKLKKANFIQEQEFHFKELKQSDKAAAKNDSLSRVNSASAKEECSNEQKSEKAKENNLKDNTSKDSRPRVVNSKCEPRSKSDGRSSSGKHVGSTGNAGGTSKRDSTGNKTSDKDSYSQQQEPEKNSDKRKYDDQKNSSSRDEKSRDEKTSKSDERNRDKTASQREEKNFDGTDERRQLKDSDVPDMGGRTDRSSSVSSNNSNASHSQRRSAEPTENER
uniref:THO complex subunit 2 n=1 Tax=Strigamia maritima TaxID=126957 RepID=T1IQC9_STRMM